MRIADDLTTSTSRLGAQATPRRDLDDRAQVHDLVVGFYRELVFDDVLAPVFEEVAEVDWAVHIPKLIDFWCRVLLDQPGYDGFLLGAHRKVHDRQPFEAQHFERWYALWVETIEERWEGPLAETAKRHAAKVAGILSRQLTGDDWPGATGACPAS
jgi:hemoglobin